MIKATSRKTSNYTYDAMRQAAERSEVEKQQNINVK
jgi:hypothetical protein